MHRKSHLIDPKMNCILNSRFLDNYETLPKVLKNLIDYMGLGLHSIKDITNYGKRCAKSFIFSTPTPGKITEKYTKSCTNYAFDNINQWILELLFSIPAYALVCNKLDSSKIEKLDILRIHVEVYSTLPKRVASVSFDPRQYYFRTNNRNITPDDEKWFDELYAMYKKTLKKQLLYTTHYAEKPSVPSVITSKTVRDYVHAACHLPYELNEHESKELSKQIQRSPVYIRKLMFGEVEHLPFTFHKDLSMDWFTLQRELQDPTTYLSIHLDVPQYFFQFNVFNLVGFFDDKGKELKCWNHRFLEPTFHGFEKRYSRD